MRSGVSWTAGGLLAATICCALCLPAQGAKKIVLPKEYQPDRANPQALRAAIEDLTATFGPRYPGGADYLKKLTAIEDRLRSGSAAEKQKAAEDLSQLNREALIANPLVCGQPILFVVRAQYAPDHHNTETMFQTSEINTGKFRGGSALRLIDFGKGEVRTLLESATGVLRDPEVHWDGKRVVFSMRKNAADDYHIYEMSLEGGQPRQLTAAPGVTDIDPLYTADDAIIFTSTREPKYCMCNRHIMGNLFRMEADGANIHQIGKSTLHEGHGCLLPDGRVLYDRWEYVDRNFGDAQGLWSVNPDGTNHAVVYGNNTPSPGGVIDGRPVPGTDQIVCAFIACHDRPWGAMAVLDRRKGVDGRSAVLRTWPAEAMGLVLDNPVKGYHFDSTARLPIKYEDPFPLGDAKSGGKYFLVSRMTGRGEQMGIYLVDVLGNEILLHAEEQGCFDPMPVCPRPRPPVIPVRRDYENKDGTFYVQNVYVGTHMAGVKPGAVKFLRVVESGEKRAWTMPDWSGQGAEAPAMNWHDFGNKRILGTVPVEADGSAYFRVPSDRFVYFQLLDETGRMIQSMRSGVIVQSGERAGCVGCHDSRLNSAPASPGNLLALKRPASPMEGFYGPPRFFNYLQEVQPVLDKYCVRCHNPQGNAKACAKLNLSGDKNPAFNISYAELWARNYVRVVGAGPAEIQQAYSWGSHASTLVRRIVDGHPGVKLDKESLDRIITWIDLNAPYYPTYDSAYPDNLYGRCPLDNKQVQRLEALGVPVRGRENINKVDFDRPELSPGLAKLPKGGAAYAEALSIIRAGKEMLAKRPRADMPGFVPCPLDQARERKYAARLAVEMRNRQAIREGRKVYDDNLPTPPAKP